MRSIAKIISVLLLLFSGASLAFAQTVEITIVPDEVQLGETVNITVRGLDADTEYTLDFILVANGESVFSTNRTSNASGQIALNITSESSDEPGEYRIEVRSGQRVIGEATFTLVGEGGEPSNNNGGGADLINLRVTPTEAVVGSTFDIRGSDLEAEQAITILITVDGEEVYSRDLNADERGQFKIEIFTLEGDPVGEYVVEVQDEDGNSLAVDSFEVTAPVGRNGLVDVETTDRADGGTDYTLHISDVRPFADLTVSVRAADTTEVFFTRVRASVDGIASVAFTPDQPVAAGTYEIIIREREVQVAAGELILNTDFSAAVTAIDSDVQLTVAPDSAAPNTLRIVSATGLFAGETVTIQVVQGGEVFFSETKVADVNGTVAVAVPAVGEETPGNYTVRLLRGGSVLVATPLTIEGAGVVEPPVATPEPPVVTTGDVQIAIDPTAGEIGTTHTISISGLNADELVIVTVTLNGEAVYSTERSADASGNIVFPIRSEEGDTAGVYTVSVARDGTTIASTDFEITTTTVENPPVAGNPSILIEPASGDNTTVFRVTVSELAAEETVTVNVVFDGEIVYSVERQASAEGSIALDLTASESDPNGEYTVQVVRDDQIVAESTFELAVATVVEPPAADVTVTIEPASGAKGTAHTVTIENLQPQETVTFTVLLDGNEILSGELTADDNGTATTILQTEESDAAGEYTIEVLREGGIFLASAALIVEEGTTPPIAMGNTEISITPEAGPAGTTHTIVVSNLQPAETVVINVLYDEEIVYTTERAADENGEITLELAAEDSDPAGVYSVQVNRTGSVIAEAEFTVEGDEPTIEPPVVTTNAGEVLVSASDELDEDDTERTYTFEGSEGAVVVIAANSTDFDTYLILQDQDGIELSSNDDSNSSLNSVIGPFTLPYDGEYTVIVTSYEAINGGSVSGAFEVTATLVEFNTLETAEPVAVEFGEGVNAQYFTFEAELGEVISVDVSSNLDTTLTLNDPSGVNVFSDDDSGSGYNPEVTRYVVLTAGTYTVILNNFYADSEGEVTVTLNSQARRDLADGAQPLTLNAKQANDVIVLEAEEDEEILLNVSVVAGSSEGATINVYQDDVLLMTYSANFIPEGTVVGFVAPNDGQISVILENTSGSAVTTLEVEQR